MSVNGCDPEAQPTEQPLDPASVRVTEQANWDPTGRYGEKVLNRKYLRGRRAGKGQHGHVWIAYDLDDKRRPVAIKVVKRNNPREEKQKLLRKGAAALPIAANHTALTAKLCSTEAKIKKEIAIMKKLRHSHVVRLIEIIDDKLSKTIYMVMEYLAGGELRWRTPNDEPVLTVDQTRRICRDVLLGLEYLHYQGIIHRDIKPANLVWDALRTTVKITDFGVSHFSYAQRLSVAGRAKVQADDPYDPILLDDSDLTKRAGTPFYLAPEVVWSDWDNTATASSAERHKITSQIDIWAFGITLFSLLEGRTPFTIPEDRPQHEFQIYRIVCTEDWDMPDTMGSDAIPTGGRHPTDSRTQGYMVVSLLDWLLQKDPTKRITIKQLKEHPWFLRGIADPDKWIRETSPSRDSLVEVTDSDANSAINSLEFSPWDRFSRRVYSLWRRVPRPRRPTSHRQLRDVTDEIGVNSVPCRNQGSGNVNRNKSASATMARPQKEKQRSSSRPSTAQKQAPIVGPSRSKSVDRWPSLRAKPSVSTSTLIGSAPKPRRGSENSPQNPPPRNFTRGSECGPNEQPQVHHDIFSLFSGFRHHLRSRRSHGTSLETSTTASSSQDTSKFSPVGASSGDPLSMKNAALRDFRVSEEITFSRRVSSWGDAGGYSDDCGSLHSNDDLSDRVMLEGAGGVSDGTQSYMDNAVEVAGARVPLPFGPQVDYLFSNSDASSVPPPIVGESRAAHVRSTTASPLARIRYVDSANDLCGSDGYDSSSLDDTNRDDSYGVIQTSEFVHVEDDEDSDEDGIMVSRRLSRHRSATSPPPSHNSSDDALS